MKKSDLPMLLLLPAVIGVLPVELLGIDALFLQRLPGLGPNGLPYWDLYLLGMLAAAFAVTVPERARAVHLIGGGAAALAMAFLLLRGYGPFNQNVGLFLQFSSVVAFGVSINAADPDKVLRKLKGPLIVGGSMVVVSSAVLALTTLGYDGWWGDQITQIDRFEGIDERTRWKTVRLQDRMLMCFITAFCTALAVSQRRWALFSVPFLFFAAQVVQSSRGGVLLVLFSGMLGVLFVARTRKGPRVNAMKSLLTATVCLLAAVSVVALSARAQTLLSTWTELIDQNGIRNRMYAAAWELLDDKLILGVGYIDLHVQPEWSPFILPNMLLPLHNMYMQALLYEGMLGLIFWLIPTCVGVASCFRLFVRRTFIRPEYRPLVAGLLATTPAFLYMMVFQTLDRVSLVASWVVLGLLAGLSVSPRTATAA